MKIMGRIKDLFMQFYDVNCKDGDETNITCPNCLSTKLTQNNINKMFCKTCDYYYIISDPGDEQNSISDGK